MLATALQYSHTLLQEILQPGEIAVDATMGNGHDTAFLAELVGRTGHVYAFDVQELALNNTAKRLAETPELAKRVSLIPAGHETLDQHLPADCSIKAAIFNLGYLPQSDKAVITLPETTRQALDALLLRLAPRGRVILVCYYGHVGGAEELAVVREYCQKLPQKEYNVLNYQFINQQNQPPILFCIEKKR